MVTIDAVITAFNQRELMRDAVESVLGQSVPVREMIVVDDGSSDEDSLEVLAELVSISGVRVIRHANAGVSAARNAGIRTTSADLVLVLDGDDLIAPTFVQETARALEKDPPGKDGDLVDADVWRGSRSGAAA
ncbi:glycosyltransferase family 2 protein [Timonella senegalensis]|uniref:glycosyltransferase family 2 protein n=1 Tax=Timonella senegalensis TaxID=1465825 RepID=UPI00031D87B8|nr:glycosyltransferase family 2 protein [Timonella senegalensis]